jgi:hypothetical protein
MTEPTAQTYRKRVAEARAQAASARSPEFKRQWDEIAAAYEKLAAFVEGNTRLRAKEKRA